MKKTKKLAIALTLIISGFLGSCSKGDDGGAKVELGQGVVSFQCIADSTLDVVTKSEDTFSIAEGLIPTPEQFDLKITGSYIDSENGESVNYQNQMTVADIPSEGIILNSGNYKAVVTYGDATSEGADAVCFTGEKEFTVLARKSQTISITAKLNKSVMKLSVTDWFKDYYPTDVEFYISTYSKDKSEPNNKFIFDGDGGEVYYFPALSEIKLSGKATNNSGKMVEFMEKTICSETAAQTFYDIVVDANNASQSSVFITLNKGEKVEMVVMEDFNPNNQ